MKGSLIERSNRFLADIRTQDGKTVTAYCPATGRMTTCLEEGAPVEYLRVENSDRKLDYDWWSIRMPESWVVIDTRPTNRWLYWNRTAAWFPESWRNNKWTAEPSLPDGGRLDFRIDGNDGRPAWIEIKSVTWCEDGVGYFPDAPTERGRRHLRELTALAEDGHETYVVLVSMRSDVEVIRPARSVDPTFADALCEARNAGVKLIGVESSVDDRSIRFTGILPVKTD